MKKSVSLLLFPVLVLAFALNASAQFQKLNKADELQFKKCVVKDSIKIGYGSADFDCQIVFPQVKNIVADSINANIISWIGGKKNLSIPRNVQYVKKEFFNEYREFVTDYMSDDDDSSFWPSYEQSYEIRPVYSNDKVVTYRVMNYSYMGGAHGMTAIFSHMFDTKNGREIGWNIFKRADSSEISRLIASALAKQYFEVKTIQQAGDSLFVEDLNDFPLPSNPPYLMKDGIHFIYQEYEIGPYAIGAPECVVPYDALYQYLSPLGKSIVPQKRQNAPKTTRP